LSRIDHVVFGVRDLRAAARALWEQFGLEAQPGGDHAGAGTSNMLVPIGNDQFIELLAVSDSHSRHPIVSWLSKQLLDGDRLLQVAIDPGDLDATAARLQEPARELDRVSEDGRRVGFRLTGIVGAFGPGILPFFVACTSGHQWRCGWRPAKHRVNPHGFLWVELGSDEARVRAQVDDPSLPFKFAPGRPGISAVALNLSGTPLVIRA